MRKRILAILMAVAVFVTIGPVEMFAATKDENSEVAESEAVNEMVVETPESGEESEPAVETTETEVQEEAVVEEPATEETAEEETVEAEEEEIVLEVAAAVTTVSLSCSDITTNSVNLSWTVTGDATEPLYIYRNDEELTTIEDPAAETSKVIDGLNQDTTYTFKVKIGEVESDAVRVKTAKAEVPDFRKVSSYKRVYLRWSPVAGAAKYVISGSVSGETTGTQFVHNVGTEKDIINLYNTGKGEKISGNINGKDRFTYIVTAKDASGRVLASSTTTGDIVKTLYYKLTFKNGATLTSHSGGKKKIKIKKGAVVYARGFNDGKYIFDYKCADGKVRTFYTMKIRVKAKLSSHITAVKNKKKRGSNTQPVYTIEEAEQYVNDRGVSKAKSKYMIWANLFSQKEYIFKKSGSKWTIIKGNGKGLNGQMAALQVSTGRATMPTATGVTRISKKLKSQHGTPLWNLTKYFSIHGVQKKWPTPGWPESGACVRNLGVNATWIYKNIPLYTRVYVH